MSSLPIELRGLLIGFSIAAPVGPIGILCIRRTLAAGRAIGLATGFGAATADAIYAAIAGFGLTVLSDTLLHYQNPLRLIGGAFLLYLGARTFLAPPAQQPAPAARSGSLLSAYASTFLLTLANPVTILAFLGIFAGLGIASSPTDALQATRLILSVFAGSSLWWLILSISANLLRSRLTGRGLIWINRLSGAIIAGFGLTAIISIARLGLAAGI